MYYKKRDLKRYLVGTGAALLCSVSISGGVFAAEDASERNVDSLQTLVTEQGQSLGTEQGQPVPIETILEQELSEMSTLDRQFCVLAVSIAGEQMSGANLPKFSEGYSNDIMGLYDETFGEIRSSIQNQNFSIPKDFDLKGIMQQASAERNSFVSGFMDSELYKNTISQISIGNVMNAARNGMASGMPSMLSADTMNAMMGGLSANAFGKANQEGSSLAASVSAIENSNRSRVGTIGNQMESYAANVQKTADWLQGTSQGILSSQMFGNFTQTPSNPYWFGQEAQDRYAEAEQFSSNPYTQEAYTQDPERAQKVQEAMTAALKDGKTWLQGLTMFNLGNMLTDANLWAGLGKLFK